MTDPASATRATTSPGLALVLRIGRARAAASGLTNVAPPVLLLGLVSLLQPEPLRTALEDGDPEALLTELRRLDAAIRRSGHDPQALHARLDAAFGPREATREVPPEHLLRPHTHCTLWYAEAQDRAREDPRATAGAEPHHLWRGLLTHPDGSVARVLAELGPGPAEALTLLDAPGDTWEVGEVVRDATGSFEVRDVIGAGGMGLVYRVHHREWDRELAVKAPRLESLTTDSLQAFLEEARTWVGLGRHPHVAAALVARAYRGLPRVVAEWVDGGSLADAVARGEITAGGLARVLDVAIQTAWGLDHAHAAGLVHQDVKPANVLLRRDGTALVTDFGLARARISAAGVPAAVAAAVPGATSLAGLSGFTPAYCSPEQAAGAAATAAPVVTRATDVWSWAVTVLECVMGAPPVERGPDAPAVLAACRRRFRRTLTAVELPRALGDLLARCLDPDPATRPRDLGALAAELVALHPDLVGRPYPRPVPQPGGLDLDAQVHQGLAMAELGLTGVADGIWAQVLAADPAHPHAGYCRALARWRAGLSDDAAVLAALEAARRADDGDAVHDLTAGLVHLERGDRRAARTALEAIDDRLPGDSAAVSAVELALRWAPNPPPDREDRVGRTAVVSLAAQRDSGLVISGDAAGTAAARQAGRRADEPGTGPVVVAVAPGLHAPWASGDAVGTVVVRRGAEVLLTADARAAVTALAVDAHEVVVGTEHGRVYAWTFATGAVVELAAGRADALAVLDDRGVVVPGPDGLRVQDYSGTTLARVPDVVATAFAPDGEHLVTEHPDGALVLRVTRSGVEVHRWTTASVGTGPRALTPGGHLAVGHDDGSVRVWSAERCVRTAPGDGHAVTALAADPDGRAVHAGTADGRVRTIGLPFPDARAPWLLPHPDRAAHRATAADLLRRIDDGARSGDTAAITAGVAALRALPGHRRRADTMRRLRMLAPDPGRPALAWPRLTLRVPHGGTVPVVLTDDGDAFAMEPDACGARLHRRDGTVVPLPGPVLAAATDVLACHDGDDAVVVDSRTGGVRVRVPLGGTPVALAELGARLLDGAGTVHDLATGAVVTHLDLAPDTPRALSGDGRVAAVATGTGVVVVDLATGNRRTLGEDGAAPVAQVAVDEAGGLAVVEHDDGALVSWAIGRATVLARIPGGRGVRRPFALSADGRLAVVLGVTTDLWDPTTGSRRVGGVTLSRVDRPPSMTRDGRVLLTGGAGLLQFWDVDRSYADAGPDDDAHRGTDRGHDVARGMPAV